MFHELTARDLRSLGSGVMVITVLAGLSWGLLQGPWAPGALADADRLVATGDTEQALDAYLAIVDAPVSTERRAEALWRAAQVAHAAGQLQEAATLLERFVAEHPVHDEVASAHEARAELFAAEFGRPDDAARAWSEAARASTGLDEAGARWLKAGRAWQDADELSRARSAYRSAAASPGSASRAWLALAHLELPTDPAAAYDAYDRALLADVDGPVSDIARLGMATAMERLDGAEAALADLDQSPGIDDGALTRRRARLEGELGD